MWTDSSSKKVWNKNINTEIHLFVLSVVNVMQKYAASLRKVNNTHCASKRWLFFLILRSAHYEQWVYRGWWGR